MKNKKKFYPQSQNKDLVFKIKRIFVTIILIFLFFSLTKNIFDYRKTINFYQSFKNDYEKEKKKKIILQTNILKSQDPYEVEKIIRNKLNLLKDGEVALIIPRPTTIPKKQKV
ncbi:MAG: septum formation initiator family protein, partial [bacterium]